MAIETVESLREHLQWAIEIEHATIPAYLCALYSIRPGHNAAAVEVLRSILMEEMLHMTLAANVLNAVGGCPQLDGPDFLPRYPAPLPHGDPAFRVPLARFSREAVVTFMRIEQPEAATAAPEDDRYHTLGQYYAAIEEGLVRLCRAHGEARVFSGDPARQVRPAASAYRGSGAIVAVEGLATALAALEEIREQGEGLRHREIWDGDRNMFHPERQEVAHHFRLAQLLAGRRYRPGDTPRSGPTGEPLAVDWEAVHPMRAGLRAADYPEGSEVRARIDRFDACYSAILRLLQQAFDGRPRLLAVAAGAMHALGRLAAELVGTPSGDGATTVGPSFEYVPPARRPGDRRIVVLAGGPYLVHGDVPLVRRTALRSEAAEPLAWRREGEVPHETPYVLCRCGRSSVKPFCDGTHVRCGFAGEEGADPRPSEARRSVLSGPGLDVAADEHLCMGAGFCGTRQGNVRQMVAEAGDPRVRAAILGMVERCPSGALTCAIGGEALEPDLPAQIAVTSEAGRVGPLWVTGGIPVERADGRRLETRNRVTLCRCGASGRKPLCDGAHRERGEADG